MWYNVNEILTTFYSHLEFGSEAKMTHVRLGPHEGGTLSPFSLFDCPKFRKFQFFLPSLRKKIWIVC